MKMLFDRDDQIRHPAVFDLLVQLRNDMGDSEKGNVKALGDVDKVIRFLEVSRHDSAVGTEEID